MRTFRPATPKVLVTIIYPTVPGVTISNTKPPTGEGHVTIAPPKMLDARRLLLDHLDMHPGRTVTADLDPAEVGIVGDPAHIGGYHCGADRVRRVDGVIRDYSVTESARDRAGLSDHAAALDVGWFDITSAGKRWTMYDFNRWLVTQCRAGTPDTADIREVIYTLDGTTVHRWDRLGRRSSGDNTHRWHTHISEHRDAHGRHMPTLMRRWLTHIGLIQGDDMTPEQARQLTELHAALCTPQPFFGGRTHARLIGDLGNVLMVGSRGTETTWLHRTLAAIAERAGISPAELEQIRAAAYAGAAEGDQDEAEAVRAALANLPADTARAIIGEFAEALATNNEPE